MPGSANIGSELAGYRLDELLGRGGMGVVYRAHDLALGRNVALKLLAPHLAEDVSFRERFLTESRIATSLEHPNVVPIHDAGEIDGQLYIAMRLVEGSDLKKVLRAGPLEPARAVRVLEQVASALDAAHTRGLVHRDVKPSNVLLDEGGHVYLADFGLSRYLGDAALPLGPAKSLGTADYVAPEQIRGEEVDGRADVYALGCMLYECLAGEPPFRRSTDAATLYAQLEEAPPVLSGLDEVLPKTLAKEPAERYGTCGELIDEARHALGIAEPRRSRWPLAVAVVGVTLIGAALAGFFLTRGGSGVAAEPGADSLVRIDPRTNKVTETLPVGRKASGVAADGRYVWVTNAGDGTVWRIDPARKKVLKINAHGTPTDVAVARNFAVVADGPEGAVGVINTRSGGYIFPTQITPPGTGAVLVAAGDGRIWYGSPAQGIVGPADGTILPTPVASANVRIPPDNSSLQSAYLTFDGLAVGSGGAWVAGDSYGRTAWHVDERSKRLVAAVPLGFVPAAVTAGDGAAWVTSLLGDTISRVDPVTNRITRTIRVSRGPYSAAAGEGAVWVTGSIDKTLTRIDPKTNRVVATIALHATPIDVAVGAKAVWVIERSS
jgi:DNA-binding beta-propeller fold protein YncE